MFGFRKSFQCKNHSFQTGSQKIETLLYGVLPGLGDAFVKTLTDILELRGGIESGTAGEFCCDAKQNLIPGYGGQNERTGFYRVDQLTKDLRCLHMENTP